MTATALPLTGGRKKAARRPHTEGVVRLNGRARYYARLWLPGEKRARYVSTRFMEVKRAEEVLPHLRAKLRRDAESVETVAETQLDLC